MALHFWCCKIEYSSTRCFCVCYDVESQKSGDRCKVMKTGSTVTCTKWIESCRETRKETYTKWNKVLGCVFLNSLWCVCCCCCFQHCSFLVRSNRCTFPLLLSKWFMHSVVPAFKQIRKQYAKFRALLSGEKQYYGYYGRQFGYWNVYDLFHNILMECFSMMHPWSAFSWETNLSRWNLFIMNRTSRIRLFLFTFRCIRMNIGARLE